MLELDKTTGKARGWALLKAEALPAGVAAQEGDLARAGAVLDRITCGRCSRATELPSPAAWVPNFMAPWRYFVEQTCS